MKNFTTAFKLLFAVSLITGSVFLAGCKQNNAANAADEMYDGPELAAHFEFERTKDPATGKVPRERFLSALQQTIDSKNAWSSAIGGLSWLERGPNSDLPGPSNGNTRANAGIASGRIRAILVDKSDATGKTVIIGGVDGGLWKTTDITASPASWALINDNLSNLAISDICQDPRVGFENIMYFCTGESYFNSEAVQGNGVFKSTDYGATWTYLPATASYVFCTRILCDYLGNIYLATRGTGLLRSTAASGGAVWTDITPSGLSNSICDLEISSTTAAGRLHVVAGIFTTQAYRYTDIPTTVAAATWTVPATAFPSFAMRAEICCSGSTLYSLVANASYQVPTIYKSTDGGANWASTGGQPTAGWASGQGWYSLACDIDPSSAGATCIVGGLDTWKTTNGGTSWSQISTWVGTTPVNQYVHADVHKILWYDGGNKLLFGCDGGIHYSSDKGVSISDRNKGLRIKQFYSCAIHPSTTNYFLAGAQDNGTHQFSNAGLSNTVEVTGGDGAYVAIDQNNALYQFGSYVYNQYRRSTDGGATWSSVNYSSSLGQFINPFDYDNINQRIYAAGGINTYIRWDDPRTGSTFTSVAVTMNNNKVSAVTASPYTSDLVFLGTDDFNNGLYGGVSRLLKLTAANTASPIVTDIKAGTMAATGTVSCINTGTDDQNLICTFSNYGVSNVWVSTNGGTNWTAIDGNLPDMPVRWCMFYPGSNTKAYIATETGVWETDLISAGATVWNANPTFPSVRTDMIKYRTADRTIAAATHGRGLWTATIPTVATPDLSFQTATASETETSTFSSSCRGYTDYKKYMVIANTPTGAATVTLAIAGGGSATQGVDYDITTNGNFAAQSMVLNFPALSGTAQPFTIRVYNDAAVESAENFTVNYTTTGGNAQAGATNQTLVFTINDNDAAPLASSALSLTWGLANVSAVTSGAFNGGAYTDKRLQNLYLATDLIAAGFSAGSITDFAWNFNVATIATFNNLTISIGFTNTTDLATGFVTPAPTFTTVYTGNFTTPGVTGWRNFTLPTPVNWDGSSNIVIQTCFDNTVITSDVSVLGTTVAGYSPSALIRQNAAGTVCATAAVNISATRPDIRLGLTTTGTPVSTALNSSKTAYLGPLDDVYFYDASGNIMARIKNLGGFDYGCTQVIIDRAGSATVPFWNNNTTNYLASKTFKVIPTNNTASGNYQISLYYTTAEINNWMAATGRSFATGAQVIKVSNGFYVPDVTPAVTHAADVILSPLTAGTFGLNYIATGDFNMTGFSGFGIGVAGFALPISINYFTGTKQVNGHLLNWKVNCNSSARATMILQRSADSRNFSSINSITADALRCRQPFDFTDQNPLSGINYYRLKIIDIAGKVSYSSIVALLNAVKGFEIISLTPNPAVGNNITLNISSAIALKINLAIFDMQGKLVNRQTAAVIAGFTAIPMQVGKLAAGSYSIQAIIADEKPKVIRFVKQ